MCEVTDIRSDIHEANVRRVARRVLEIVGTNKQEGDIVSAIKYKIPKLNNGFLVLFMIRRHFPSPTLSYVESPTAIADIVIEALVKEWMNSRMDELAER